MKETKWVRVSTLNQEAVSMLLSLGKEGWLCKKSHKEGRVRILNLYKPTSERAYTAVVKESREWRIQQRVLRSLCWLRLADEMLSMGKIADEYNLVRYDLPYLSARKVGAMFKSVFGLERERESRTRRWCVVWDEGRIGELMTWYEVTDAEVACGF